MLYENGNQQQAPCILVSNVVLPKLFNKRRDISQLEYSLALTVLQLIIRTSPT